MKNRLKIKKIKIKLTTMGFTLTELLGVIVILGILVLVAFRPLLSQIKKSKSEINESTKLLIIDAAKDYIKDNINDYETVEGKIYCINISTLTESNYLNENLKNEKLEKIDTSKNVKITYNNNKFNYDVINDCTDNTFARYNIEVPIVTEDSGLYRSIEKGRLIYRGANPNNYIILNEGTTSSPSNTTYRIISYEADGTIKVIRNAKIESLALDERDPNDVNTGPRHNDNNTYCNYSGKYYGCNVWGNMNNTYYNGSAIGNTFFYRYYNNNTDTELTNSTNTGTVTVDSTLNQYLNNTWITDKEMSKYIDNHDFNVGAVYYTSEYTGGDKGLQKEKTEEKLYTWNGKIGLMNITDYVEASTNPDCTSVYSNYYYNPNYYYEGSQHLTGYDNWPCSNRTYNWIPKGIMEWFISPYPQHRLYLWFVNSTGYFNFTYAYNIIWTRPSFYLKSNISLTGDGSETTPYRIIE